MSRELDREIATKLFGIGMIRPGVYVPACFSTDMAAAWKVVERMRSKGWMPTVYFSLNENCWVCDLRHKHMAFDINGHWLGGGDTAPLAICRAALAALNYEQLAGVPNGAATEAAK